MFRFMLNSGFVFDNVMRLSLSSIDYANNLTNSPSFFLDLIFDINPLASGSD